MLKLLLLEDAVIDAELMLREIKQAGIECVTRRVETEPEFRDSLKSFAPDVILSDFSLPSFDGLTALEITMQERPDTPFLFVSGTIGEERAIESLKRGAADYVLKTNLARLPAAIQRAVAQAQERAARKRAEAELHVSIQRFENAARATNDAVWDWDLVFDRVWWNETFGRLFGYSAGWSGSAQEAWGSRIHQEDAPRVLDGIHKLIASGERYWNNEYRFRCKNGDVAYVLDRGYVIRDKGGRAVRVIGAMMDITERRAQQEKISRLSRIHSVLSGINSAIVRIRDRQELLREAVRIAVEHGEFALAWIGLITSGRKRIRPVAWMGADAECVAKLKLSLTEEDALPRRVVVERKTLVSQDVERDANLEFIRESALEKGLRSLAVLPLSVGSRVIGVLTLCAREQGFFDREELKLLSELVADISFALEYIEKEEKLDYLAFHDVLTGLPNRTLFLDRVQQQVQAARADERGVGVFVIDVERFHLINETFGRQAGDDLLKEMAESLTGILRGADHAARLSADQFALAVSGLHERELAALLEQKIVGALSNVIFVMGEEVRIGFKTGVAIFPNDGEAADELLANAETALKKAKKTGERFFFYTRELNERIAHKLNLENRLHRALAKNQFALFYQPKVNLATRELTGLEALLRWNDPAHGLRLPGDFIPALEETGLILEVGRWVIEQALSDQRRWRKKGLIPPPVAVNVSALQLRRKSFAAEFKSALAGSSSERALALELTETAIMEDLETNTPKLHELREMGIAIAIDDFGTGYSSLSYITKLPIDILKIDRSFIANVHRDLQSRTIVSTVISLADALQLEAVAEGVELEAQANVLQLLNCGQMQGNLASPPLPFEEIEKLLATGAFSPRGGGTDSGRDS